MSRVTFLFLARRQLRQVVHGVRAIHMGLTDLGRFQKHSAPAGQATSAKNARALIMYYTHSIEKGLSRQDFRPGFGIKPISALASLMNKWEQQRNSDQDEFFMAACATMRAYLEKNRSCNANVEDKISLFSPKIQDQILNAATQRGVRAIVANSKPYRSFAELASTRVSTRDFAPGYVDYEKVRSAIETATLSPSACNRQSSRVHVLADSDTIDAALKIQAGLGGYTRPPLLLLITSDASCYVEATERNQPFVDGALFAMTLMYALEDQNIGSCALTAMLWKKNEDLVRTLLNLPSSEFLVTFIALGEKRESTLVPFSQREKIEDIVRLHGNPAPVVSTG